MRRSASVSSLLLIGAASTFALTGCDDTPPQADVQIFPTVEACQAKLPADQCKQAFEQSQQVHLQNAPRYDSADECRSSSGGQCQQIAVPRADGGSSNVFIPAIAGFMLGRALSGGGNQIGYGGGYYPPRPIYVDRDGFARSGDYRIGQLPGGSRSVPSSGTTLRAPSSGGEVGVRAPTTTTSRGGFGATAARMGAAGGGS